MPTEKVFECVNVLDGLEEIILHAAGFDDSGKTRQLLYRDHYYFSDSDEYKEKVSELDNLYVCNKTVLVFNAWRMNDFGK